MRKWTVRALLFAGLVATACRHANADVLIDHSPAATGAVLNPGSPGSYFLNSAGYQNFGEFVIFSQGVTLTGVDIYTSSSAYAAQVGMSATVRLWADAAGVPGALITQVVQAISAVDTEGTASAQDVVRVHVDLTSAIQLSAGTGYWIGMSGTFDDLGQLTLVGPNAPGDGYTAQFSGATYDHAAAIGDMAFRLEGTVVPEPASWLMGISAGVVGLALARRARRSA